MKDINKSLLKLILSSISYYHRNYYNIINKLRCRKSDNEQ